MGKTRGSHKTCPDCFEQVSSSMKICYCGGTLTLKKSNSIGNSKNKSSSRDNVTIRRTERIKRGKPDYYDPLEYERQQKKERKKRTSSGRVVLPTQLTQLNNGKSTKEVEPTYSTSHRMHLKTKKKKKKVEVEPPPKEEELEEIILSKETLAKFSLILEEINRKIYASSWRIYND